MMAALACRILSLICCLILCFLVSGALCWCPLFFLLLCFLDFTSPEKKEEEKLLSYYVINVKKKKKNLWQ